MPCPASETTAPGCRPPRGGAQNPHTKETRSPVGKEGNSAFKPSWLLLCTPHAKQAGISPHRGRARPEACVPPARSGRWQRGERSRPLTPPLPPSPAHGHPSGRQEPRGQPPRGTEVPGGPDARTQCRTPGAQPRLRPLRASPSPRFSLPFQFSGCFLSWAVTARTQHGSPLGSPPLWSSGEGWHPQGLLL